MLRERQVYLLSMENYGFMLTPNQRVEVFSGSEIYPSNCEMAFKLSDDASEETPGTGDADAPLDDAAEDEREYVRERLREELKREPTESELDEWLRQHTEGY